MKKISDQVYYVGVNDNSKQLFEGLWPLPEGVTYNSYLVVDEKVCLMDTVETGFFPQFLANIREVIGDRPIDYVVVHHMEPDHSSSLSLLREFYPDIKIVGNKKTFDMMGGFYGIDDGCVEVKNGDSLSLGKHTLNFYLIPMVHWPETMLSVDVTTHVAFTGDAFGCFGALNGGVIDSEINTEKYWLEMIRYYANIVGRYGTPVQNALKKLADVRIDYLCPTHGPVWHEHAAKVVSLYDKMSKYEGENGLVIAYGTMYGNTAQMAEVIAEAASQAGIEKISLIDLSKVHYSYALRDIFRYKGLILGAPTYNNSIFPKMEQLLSAIENRSMKNRVMGWFGSYCWASKAVSIIGQYNEKFKFEPVGEPVEMKQSLNEETHAKCVALGQAMAAKLLAE
ncbi:metallo-beta-lactamase domain protein [Hallella bergensis DSM 17361]|uniref:Metallo-beta-lactamase domain protein n=1 Tax=Hallella bergensis DSM 17361 TaxID=585502 RepID=D1PZ08_9BACT|nr:FprA family A-type flavoprotein [Hallella bergensis]EFA43424.1 metallo-beta-lactamase domain protein [Hallella bergensis DSM 17361]